MSLSDGVKGSWAWHMPHRLKFEWKLVPGRTQSEGCSLLLSVTSAFSEKPEWAPGVSDMREFGGLLCRKKGQLN